MTGADDPERADMSGRGIVHVQSISSPEPPEPPVPPAPPEPPEKLSLDQTVEVVQLRGCVEA